MSCSGEFNVIALVKNLSVREMLRGEVTALGGVLVSPRELKTAADRAAAYPGAIVIADLAEHPDRDLLEAEVLAARTGGASAVLGFFPHVQAEIGSYYTECGLFDNVLPRSKFFRDLRALISTSRELVPNQQVQS